MRRDTSKYFALLLVITVLLLVIFPHQFIQATRAIVGILFVFFLPGISITYAIYDRDEIGFVKRIFIGFAFSISVIPFALLMMSLAGIEITVLLSIGVITVVSFCGIAIYYIKQVRSRLGNEPK